ncbi:YecA family protein [Cyclobacterium roseum]|uniref:YecA family protein n=1 Tax=Cyclobacterium roseum TaxID=2666137 RepID=UPI00192ECC7D|nr:SEC-C metal-binding domain-containing protein [Cyclobacterium roseum]
MKIGRNDPCHCGSGKKYKKCCLHKDEEKEIFEASMESDSEELFPVEDFWEDSILDFDDDDDDMPPFQMNPDISDEENRLLEEWWNIYDDLDSPERIQNHIESFMSEHPELMPHLEINEGVVFSMGNGLRREDRFSDYVSFLIDYSKRFPEVYAEAESYYNLDIIAWLISIGKNDEIDPYLTPFVANPSEYADELFDLVDLLTAKDIIKPLRYLISKTKPKVVDSMEVWRGEDLLIPLLYDKLTPFLKKEYTDEDLSNLVDQLKEFYSIENRDELLSLWTSRFGDIFRSYKKWDFDLRWTKKEKIAFYFSISDNYMRYLHEHCGISWISAQFHSNMIYEYGLAYLDLKKGKKLKQPFDFSKETMDKVIQTVAGDTFGILNPNTVFSFINAIYYFPEYLSACDMSEDEDSEAVRETLVYFYDMLFPNLAGYSSLTFCYKEFPFWEKPPSGN